MSEQTSKKPRDQQSHHQTGAPVPAAPRVSQAAPAKVALVGGTQYFFPNSPSICSLLCAVRGGSVSGQQTKKKRRPLPRSRTVLREWAAEKRTKVTGRLWKVSGQLQLTHLWARSHSGSNIYYYLICLLSFESNEISKFICYDLFVSKKSFSSLEVTVENTD